MDNNNNKALNRTSEKRLHHHRHKKHSASVRKKSFKEKMHSLWRKILKKLGGEGTKKETSFLLATVIIMLITVPVVIAILDFISKFFIAY